MAQKIITGFFAAIWGGACYYAGKAYPANNTIIQNNVQTTYSTLPIVSASNPDSNLTSFISIQSPKITKTQNSDRIDTFVDGVVEPPYRIITYPNFKALYSTYHKCPLAVHQKFTRELTEGDGARRDQFFEQPTISSQFLNTRRHYLQSNAYSLFYFARGHMSPASSYGSQQFKWQTFTLANIVPQNQYNNAGIWNVFQRYSRDLATKGLCQSVETINGPIYSKRKPYQPKTQSQKKKNFNNIYKTQSIVLLQNGIVASDMLYKIIKCNTKTGQSYVSGFTFQNQKINQNDSPLTKFITPIQQIEDQTGLKFNLQNGSQSNNQKKMKTLQQLDPAGLSKLKKEYDYEFYMSLMSKSKSISDLNNGWTRAKQQDIKVPIKQFKQLSSQLFQFDIDRFKYDFRNKDQKIACQTLYSLMDTNKTLHFMGNLQKQYIKQIQQAQNLGEIELCYQKAAYLVKKDWKQFDINNKQSMIQKKQKQGVNNIIYNIKSAVKDQKAYKQKKQKQQSEGKSVKGYPPFIYINQQKLKQFLEFDQKKTTDLQT